MKHKGRARNKPQNPAGIFLPYQSAWITDDARLKLMEKGRQIGLSWSSAYACVERTAAQGALAWLWGRSPQTIPIPGFKGVLQAEENARALERGPLTPAQMDEVQRLLAPIALAP